MTHDFNSDIIYEQSNFTKQDSFYKKILGSSIKIERISFDSEDNRELQRNDIDLRIYLPNGEILTISEKNRKRFFGDVLLECYSKFPHTRGWMDHSLAREMVYFLPDYVIWINKIQLVEFYKRYLISSEIDSVFNDLIQEYPLRSCSIKKSILIDKIEETLVFVQAYNQPVNSACEWYTESVAVRIDTLRRHGVNVRIFNY